MRNEQEIEYHQWQLREVERLIAKGVTRKDIARALGCLPPRVSGLARELKNAGRIPDMTPDQAAAYAEFIRVHVLLAAEERRRM
jgi:ParB-like chromosome segregation protein Spo0J